MWRRRYRRLCPWWRRRFEDIFVVMHFHAAGATIAQFTVFDSYFWYIIYPHCLCCFGGTRASISGWSCFLISYDGLGSFGVCSRYYLMSRKRMVTLGILPFLLLVFYQTSELLMHILATYLLTYLPNLVAVAILYM